MSLANYGFFVLDKKATSKYYKVHNTDTGNEKEEYITRLPREKHPSAERCFEDRLMEGSF